MNNFKELRVWQLSIELVTKIYSHTSDFPDFEKFRLLQQVCGSAVSIPSNISEGAGRNTKKEFNQFLGYALGSSFELETQWQIAKNLDYITESQHKEIFDGLYAIQSMIIKLKRSLT